MAGWTRRDDARKDLRCIKVGTFVAEIQLSFFLQGYPVGQLGMLNSAGVRLKSWQL